jgi:hypothetical protein
MLSSTVNVIKNGSGYAVNLESLSLPKPLQILLAASSVGIF